MDTGKVVKDKKPYHAWSVDKCLKELNTSIDKGLTTEEAKDR